MEKSKINVAVLLIFFTRVDKTKKVFAEIRKAKPAKLFLYQDGPRKGRNDDAGILACRKIVENIDWDCEVHKWYQEQNQGCDPSEYLSQKWMFSFVDKGIILEDDDVPSQSFFPFCKELLDKYENDPRVCMISGMNHMGTVDVGADYFFCKKHGPIWGWATWRRFVNMWDTTYSFMTDKRAILLLRKSGELTDSRYQSFKKYRIHPKPERYEAFCSSTRIFNSMFAIIPSKNLISNIGVGEDGTHYGSDLKAIPPRQRRLLYMKTYEYNFPLKHPLHMVDDVENAHAIDEAMKVTFFDKLYILFYRLKNKLR